jgi:hypothetical protein
MRYVRFSQAEMDPYSEIQYAWTFARANRVADFQGEGKAPDEASLETLESVFFTYQDPDFPDRGKTRSAWIPATDRRLKFTTGCNREKHPSFTSFPVWVRIGWPKIPWRWRSWSIKTASPPWLHQQSFQLRVHGKRLDVAMPAYLPADGHDMQVASDRRRSSLERVVSGPVGRKSAVGLFHGGLRFPVHRGHFEPTNQIPTHA